MKIVDKISVTELKEMAKKMDGNIVKADIDIVRKIVIVDMPMHFEGEQELLEQGSKQKDIWGINLVPAQYGSDGFILFDSMINIKVHHNNPSMDIKSAEIRSQIKAIIDEVTHE
ncbi:hypothetical protein HY003_02075 [Candidatus Saccharibacteria bacterium]|nr:hypothetical protein [Candidatus Saccharibacteria bacterium]MBI3338063.1 hypothetical protein [Candidatus Saccharibacteria bacterium]